MCVCMYVHVYVSRCHDYRGSGFGCMWLGCCTTRLRAREPWFSMSGAILVVAENNEGSQDVAIVHGAKL